MSWQPIGKKETVEMCDLCNKAIKTKEYSRDKPDFASLNAGYISHKPHSYMNLLKWLHNKQEYHFHGECLWRALKPVITESRKELSNDKAE